MKGNFRTRSRGAVRIAAAAVLMLMLTMAMAMVAAPSMAASPPAGSLADFRVIELSGPARTGPVELTLEAFGQRFEIVLDDNSELFHGSRHASIRPDRHRFLRGQVRGIADSWARLSWIDGRWTGGFFDGTELYLVDQAATLADLLERSLPEGAELLLYRFSDLALPGVTGHAPIHPGQRAPSGNYAEFIGHLVEISRLEGTLWQMPVTIVSDTQFTGTHGANTAAVTAGRVNFIDGIYSSQLGTGIALHHHEILSNNGPLTSTSASTLLVDQFRPFMASGAGSSIPFAGLAHLFTGRNLNGSTVGIAYLGVLCNSGFGYGVDQNLSSDTNSALVFAHELGHNFNAPHDGAGACVNEPFRGIMNPSLNGSQQFSNCSLEQMSASVASATCLVESPSQDLIFSDRFEA